MKRHTFAPYDLLAALLDGYHVFNKYRSVMPSGRLFQYVNNIYVSIGTHYICLGEFGGYETFYLGISGYNDPENCRLRVNCFAWGYYICPVLDECSGYSMGRVIQSVYVDAVSNQGHRVVYLKVNTTINTYLKVYSVSSTDLSISDTVPNGSVWNISVNDCVSYSWDKLIYGKTQWSINAQNADSATTSTNSVNATNIHVTPTSDTIYFIGVTSSSEATGPAYQITNAMYYGNTTGIFFTSDKRRKHDISYITKQDSELFFSHKYFKHFYWNHNDKSSYGVIAQEIEKWCPEAVNHNEKSGYLAVNYQIVHSKAIAVMEDKINALEEQIKELQKLIK